MIFCSAFIKYRCIRTWQTCYSALSGSIPAVPFYIINHSVLSSRPISTQLLPSINPCPVDDVPSSPLTSCDDDLDFNSPVDGASNASPEMFTIDTKFNPSLPRNIKVEYNVDNRLKFTDKERGFAMKAKTCTTLTELTKEVSYLSLGFFSISNIFFDSFRHS